MPEKSINEIFIDNLKRLIEERRVTSQEFAKAINVSPSTVSMWITNKSLPRMELLDKIADYFNIDVVNLYFDNSKQNERISVSSKKGVAINVLGRVAAGIPIEAIEDIIDTEEISDEMAKSGEFFGLQIHGDSMEPRMCEGDVVIVRKQDDAESGDIVIAMINGDDATCKRLRKYRDGIELISNNPSYEPMFFSNQEIQEKPVRIIGKVVELRGKF